MTDTQAEMSPEMAQELNVTATLINAVHELFGDDRADCPIPSLGNRMVKFKAAKFKHLEEISELVFSMIAGFSGSELNKIVSTVSAEQEAKIAAGDSPYALDTSRLVRDAAGPDGAVYMKLMSGCLRTLPKLAPMFTDLTAEEFGELDADEAMIVAFGIFQRNYAFFTQRLLPVIAAFIAQQKRRTK
jgi:hypothetical protein